VGFLEPGEHVYAEEGRLNERGAMRLLVRRNAAESTAGLRAITFARGWTNAVGADGTVLLQDYIKNFEPATVVANPLSANASVPVPTGANAESNDDARPLELRISPTLNEIPTPDEQIQALLNTRDGQAQVLLTFYRENAVDKTEPEVFAIIDKWRHKTGYGGIRFEYNPVDDPAMTSAQWEAMCQALAKEMGQATDPATGQLMGNTMGHQNRPPGRVRPPGEEDHRKQGAKHSMILVVVGLISGFFCIIYMMISIMSGIEYEDNGDTENTAANGKRG
jgi:hypothetical protein